MVNITHSSNDIDFAFIIHMCKYSALLSWWHDLFPSVILSECPKLSTLQGHGVNKWRDKGI